MTLREKLSEFEGKRVLVTGHTGFKGSWLIALLNVLGARVSGYALPPEGERPLFDLLRGAELCNPHVLGNICNQALLQEVVTDTQPEFVLHLAAQSLVRRSYREPLDTWKVNAIGTVQLLEAIRRLASPCSVVVITTDKVYENPETAHPFSESDPLGGYDPYSASKAAAELVVASYRRSFFPPHAYGEAHSVALASARSGNVIGGGDAAEDRLMPDLFRAVAAGETVRLRNPASTRPWQHVLEPLTGYLLLLQKLRDAPQVHGKAYNFGPSGNQEASVQQVVEESLHHLGRGSFQAFPEAEAPHEAQRLQLDSTRAITDLEWRPRYTWQDAISRTVAWHSCADPRAETFRQIEDYLSATLPG